MKLRESVVQLKMFQARGKRCEIAQLEMMIKEFERIMTDLKAQIIDEERKSGNSDINHFAYSTFARAARQRFDNITDSIHDLQLRKENAQATLCEIETELQRAKILDGRETKQKKIMTLFLFNLI
ncbi:flagellar export protein FliJ [Bartonella bacilliformis]|uniref:flagellar export protein FliJ n=1 Tax=Bartonella bacilliformis TaxID=774 RepID=UPI0039E50663